MLNLWCILPVLAQALCDAHMLLEENYHLLSLGGYFQSRVPDMKVTAVLQHDRVMFTYSIDFVEYSGRFCGRLEAAESSGIVQKILQQERNLPLP